MTDHQGTTRPSATSETTQRVQPWRALYRELGLAVPEINNSDVSSGQVKSENNNSAVITTRNWYEMERGKLTDEQEALLQRKLEETFGKRKWYSRPEEQARDEDVCPNCGEEYCTCQQDTSCETCGYPRAECVCGTYCTSCGEHQTACVCSKTFEGG
jgi:hypothetical protein